MSICSARVEDLPRLIALDHVAQRDRERGKIIEDAILSGRAWTIEDSKKIVGYGIISHEFFGRSFIELIYIEDMQRSKGYGPELIQYLETQSISSDLFTSTNESNGHMQHVLAKLGYERSGVIHNLDPDDPEVIYVKKGVGT